MPGLSDTSPVGERSRNPAAEVHDITASAGKCPIVSGTTSSVCYGRRPGGWTMPISITGPRKFT